MSERPDAEKVLEECMAAWYAAPTQAEWDKAMLPILRRALAQERRAAYERVFYGFSDEPDKNGWRVDPELLNSLEEDIEKAEDESLSWEQIESALMAWQRVIRALIASEEVEDESR